MRRPIRYIAFLLATAVVVGCDDGGDDPAEPLDAAPADWAPDMSEPEPEGEPEADRAEPEPEADQGEPEPEADMGEPEPEADMGEPEPMPGGSACPADTKVGGVFVSLEDGFTAVQGQIANGVRPIDVPEVFAAAGECELLVPPTLFCEPACGPNQVCSADGCIDAPANVSVGPITVDGLANAVEMTAMPPVFFYNYRGDLPDPPYAMGALIRARSDGGDYEPFDLSVVGVERLVLDGDTVPLNMGEPAILNWTAAMGDGTEVHIDLNIANHGGTPGRIECTVPDTGNFAVPSELVDALLMNGFSGFPTAILTRRSIQSADIDLGCVQFESKSTAVFDLQIDGLTSCSNDDDCPEGQICQPDLTCGE